MNAPEIYAKSNRYAYDGAECILAKLGHLIKWNPDNTDTILDVGCGPANVLVDVFLPSFKGKYSTCYATDLSKKMIEFAEKAYKGRKDLEFMVMDILDVDEFLSKHGQLNHVISCFVLHWLVDAEKGFRNIYNVLNPGGDFLTVHLSYMKMYELFEFTEASEKWSKYFNKVSKHIPDSNNSQQPEKDLRDLLTRIGFTVVAVELLPQKVFFEDRNNLTTTLRAVMAQIDNIPVKLQSDYLEEAVEYGIKCGSFVPLESGRFSCEASKFHVFARKPE